MSGTVKQFEYVQRNDAEPAKVFPLLCPVREGDWVPGWQYRLVYSKSGYAELGCVFTTPNPDGSETAWICTRYEPESYAIDYAWVWSGMIATRLEIRLEAADVRATRATIRYTYTPLSERGEEELRGYDRAWWEDKMRSWERAINYYLAAGSCIGDEHVWE